MVSMLPMQLFAAVNGTVVDTEGEPIMAANVYWANTSHATSTDDKGQFAIDTNQKSSKLVVGFLGYNNDTIQVNNTKESLKIILHQGIVMNEVNVVARKVGLLKSRHSLLNQDIISSAELAKAACCNLGESFTTNPSVDVNYSDAATGAKQIKLLGLSGTYVQMLSENIPNYRGAASPYSLGYIPGPWMQSIQVSKGTASVKNGYEAIAGQINVEFKKPQTAEEINVNLYANSKAKLEANVDGNIHLNKRLSTGLLLHYENSFANHDANHDGFLDLPRVTQYNLQNRWAWMDDNYVMQASVKGLYEKRTNGQSSHIEETMNTPLYKIGVTTNRYEAFIKNAYIFDKIKNTNVALILSGSLHKQDAFFGHKTYGVNQTNGYASLMFETNFSQQHNLSTGLSVNYDNFDQTYKLKNVVEAPTMNFKDKEVVPGAYAQYTFNWNSKWSVMGGLRIDRSNLYGTFITPRAHVKFTPIDILSFRASAGKGYRTNHVLAENNYLMASSREILIDNNLKQEEAWNYGLSATLNVPLFDKMLNLNAEYYYINFLNQVVIDMDSNPHAVHFGNLKGKSYSHTFQVDVSYPFFRGFTLTAAYRYNDAKSTYNGVLMERALVGKQKGLITASYQTPLGLWQIDATLQLNGGRRMPTPYMMADGTQSWSIRYKGFEQLNMQVTRWFRNWSIYVGGENITGFQQKNPIISADSPWGANFDSTMTWGPMHGAIFYAGIRLKLSKD